jgi:hypothetical protein
MRKIINPIPLYARRTGKAFPEYGTPYGYDLKEGDLVAPHGKGKQTDLLFTVFRDHVDGLYFSGRIRVTFPNPGDGLIEHPLTPPLGGKLRLPHAAPEEGYQPEWTLEVGNSKERHWYGFENSLRETMNFFLRTRTELDEQGRVKTAHYAKVHGAFHTSGMTHDRPGIFFQYYFNPTPNDRNLEFDPTRNLSRGLGLNERVSDP